MFPREYIPMVNPVQKPPAGNIMVHNTHDVNIWYRIYIHMCFLSDNNLLVFGVQKWSRITVITNYYLFSATVVLSYLSTKRATVFRYMQSAKCVHSDFPHWQPTLVPIDTNGDHWSPSLSVATKKVRTILHTLLSVFWM